MTVEIIVYAQFPKTIVPNAEIDLNPENWEWERCLYFPVRRLRELDFSRRPYKWIRYATGVVVGARGDLCRDRDSPNPVPMDYDSDLPTESIYLYYHIPDQQKRQMCPIDPYLDKPKTGLSTQTSTRQTSARGSQFRKAVLGRDERCVLTGDPPRICQAAHLLPHSKGNGVWNLLYRLMFSSLTISLVAVY